MFLHDVAQQGRLGLRLWLMKTKRMKLKKNAMRMCVSIWHMLHAGLWHRVYRLDAPAPVSCMGDYQLDVKW
jgi:hypothetical protein